MNNRFCSPRLLVPPAVLLLCAGLTWPAAPAGPEKKPANPVAGDHAAQMARGLEIFKKHVRPLLVQHCLKCHGGEKTKSGLDMSDRAGLLRGGDSGPALLAGKSRESLLYRLITHAREPHMPRREPKLPAEAVAHIAAWIDNGAPYDQPLVAPKSSGPSWTERVLPAEARRFWSYQPLRRPSLPSVRDKAWCRTPVDHFILAKLEAGSLAPSPAAGKRQLIRRAYFDLLGLPPPPTEVEAFVKDPDPRAYEKLLDRLLANPHYGERWARHWLDLARFAESHGFEHDSDRPTAYHFRDFVIKALNDDLPFDTFVKWQLAGDELAPENNEALKATGFLAAGVHSTQITANEVEKHRYDEMDDMLATAGTSMLGLTVGCARCHDHKFDPIPQRDYYRLLSTFTTTVRSEVELKFPPESGQKKQPAPVKALISTEGLKPLRLHTQGADFLKETHFLRRGDPTQKEGVATQGFLQVLTRAPDREKHWQSAPPRGWRTSYRRRALAGWITDVDEGAGHLLARVIVNRLWQHHLGRGLVATPSDFGTRGEPPPHPELLDWLAAELVREGWHLKPIHKLIMTSAVYMQGSQRDEAKLRQDPENRLFWRRHPQRLEAEVIRDALLTVSGELDSRMYGPGTLDQASKRRSIYFTVKRSRLVPMMQVFDSPEALSGVSDRPTSTVAPQALLLMNNPNVRGWALSFGRRCALEPAVSLEKAVNAGYLIALSRPPTAGELADAAAFLKQQQESYRTSGKANARELAVADFGQVLMCLNEFVYVD